MNITKNGIFIETRPKSNREKIVRKPKPVPFKLFVTLTRIEDHHRVWLVMPFFKKEVRKLEREGWRIDEIWKPLELEVVEV